MRQNGRRDRSRCNLKAWEGPWKGAWKLPSLPWRSVARASRSGCSGPLAVTRRRRCDRPAGIAQGPDAARLPRARHAAGRAQPCLRPPLGRPQRPARRTALVPDQAPAPARRPDRPVVQAQADHVSLALEETEADVLAVQAAARTGLDGSGTGCAGRAGRPGSAGPSSTGSQADRAPAFETWLSGQRRHFRALHLGVVGRLCDVHPPGSPARLAAVERRAALMPDDVPSHVALLEELAEQSRLRGRRGASGRRRPGSFVARASTPRRCAPRGGRCARAACHRHPPRCRSRRSRRAPLAAGDPAARVVDPAAVRARPRVAIMPPSAQSPGASPLADAITHDIIGRLARLRSLAVIAWGSVSALARRGLAPDEAAAALRADYLASVVRPARRRPREPCRRAGGHRDARACCGARPSTSAARTGSSCWRGGRAPSWPRWPMPSNSPSATARWSRRRGRSTRGRPTTAASGTCTGSPRPRTAWRRPISRQAARARPHLRARLCGPVLHPLAERLPALGRPRPWKRKPPRRPPPAACWRTTSTRMAHWAMGRALVAARQPRREPGGTAQGRRHQPQLRARPLRDRLRAVAVGRSGRGHPGGRAVAPAQPVRPAALRHLRGARHGACAAGALRRRVGLGAARGRAAQRPPHHPRHRRALPRAGRPHGRGHGARREAAGARSRPTRRRTSSPRSTSRQDGRRIFLQAGRSLGLA